MECIQDFQHSNPVTIWEWPDSFSGTSHFG